MATTTPVNQEDVKFIEEMPSTDLYHSASSSISSNLHEIKTEDGDSSNSNVDDLEANGELRLEDCQTLLAKKAEEISNLRVELRVSQSGASGARKELETVLKELGTALKEKSDKSVAVKNLRHANTSLKKEIMTLRKDLASTEVKLDSSNQENLKLKDIIQNLETLHTNKMKSVEEEARKTEVSHQATVTKLEEEKAALIQDKIGMQTQFEADFIDERKKLEEKDAAIQVLMKGKETALQHMRELQANRDQLAEEVAGLQKKLLGFLVHVDSSSVQMRQLLEFANSCRGQMPMDNSAVHNSEVSTVPAVPVVHADAALPATLFSSPAQTVMSHCLDLMDQPPDQDTSSLANLPSQDFSMPNPPACRKFPPPGPTAETDISDFPTWMKETSPKRFPYYPQMGDRVYFFGGSYVKFMAPLRFPGFEVITAPYQQTVVFAKITEIQPVTWKESETSEYRFHHLVLTLETATDPFTILYCVKSNKPADFIMLKQHVDELVAQKLKVGDRVRALFSGEKSRTGLVWQSGRIFMVNGRNGQQQHMFTGPEDQLRIKWDDDKLGNGIAPLPLLFPASAATTIYKGTPAKPESLQEFRYVQESDGWFGADVNIAQFEGRVSRVLQIIRAASDGFSDKSIPSAGVCCSEFDRIQRRTENDFYRHYEALVSELERLAKFMDEKKFPAGVAKQLLLLAVMIKTFKKDRQRLLPFLQNVEGFWQSTCERNGIITPPAKKSSNEKTKPKNDAADSSGSAMNDTGSSSAGGIITTVRPKRAQRVSSRTTRSRSPAQHRSANE